ncbi:MULTISPECIES: polyprenol phosphomannose-dependent alpha 1,6 mannosyltransferase MptB [unclassified Nocardia]|uniref:polyprenol phosphomannose-dependent alpha 1,6 mannosyltransferase MptB n=1 Tax=unclassified Nocardia TaxID=2637762 RepID=UPI001CE46C58|nr:MULTISPECIES: polyprenol phosphomannose-dependent alpha 1,6 mannosyltransferase MptB [unclassified Nocardia]
MAARGSEDVTEQIRRIRLFGATGSVLLAIGALGAGAQPVLQDPTQGVRFIGLFARVPTSAMTMCLLGIAMIVAAWLLLGRFVTDLSRAQLLGTVGLWTAPLVVAPPLFSQDVYSYLAQGEIGARGLDPYALGPGPALGIDNVLTRAVPTIWRDTPAPYGPLFLSLGRGISRLTGDDIVASILMHRAVALIGIALIAWALPHLAVRCGVAPVRALWLGAANPLVLFHLVAGVHNEALMMGLMLTGVVAALTAIEADGPPNARTAALLTGGCALIALAAMVKIPALVALGFIGMALARRWIRRGMAPLFALPAAAALTAAVAGTVMLVTSTVSGLGFGWLGTLDIATAIRSWLSPSTALGMITGFGGVLLGLGDHTTAVLGFTRPLGELIAAAITVRLLFSVYRDRLHPVGGLGLSIAAIVILFPVMHPWYLLWAILPLAAWAATTGYQRAIIGITVLFSFLQVPSGSEYQSPFAVALAAAAAAITGLTLIFFTRTTLPWRATGTRVAYSADAATRERARHSAEPSGVAAAAQS